MLARTNGHTPPQDTDFAERLTEMVTGPDELARNKFNQLEQALGELRIILADRERALHEAITEHVGFAEESAACAESMHRHCGKLIKKFQNAMRPTRAAVGDQLLREGCLRDV